MKNQNINVTQELSPMMKKWLEEKKRLNDDSLLAIRLGDFYEFFFNDAVEASKVGPFTLTNRRGVPMCGFPYHALDRYVATFESKGVKLAILENVFEKK
jgi:DNA mismatch repair protein MutS